MPVARLQAMRAATTRRLQFKPTWMPKMRPRLRFSLMSHFRMRQAGGGCIGRGVRVINGSQYPIGHGTNRKAADRAGWHVPVLVRDRLVGACRTIGCTSYRIGAGGAAIHVGLRIGGARQTRPAFG